MPTSHLGQLSWSLVLSAVVVLCLVLAHGEANAQLVLPDDEKAEKKKRKKKKKDKADEATDSDDEKAGDDETAGDADQADGEDCPEGMSITVDTKGQCCWPGQVWNGEKCVGKPTSCPDGFEADAEAQACVETSAETADGDGTAADADEAGGEADAAAAASVDVSGPMHTFDIRVDFSVLTRETFGRVAGGLVFGINVHPAIAVDARVAYGDGRGDPLEWLSVSAAGRVRPLAFLDGTNVGGNLAVQIGYELFMGTEVGDAAALDFLAGFEYRTPAGFHFLALAGPALLFQDIGEFDKPYPEARIGFGHSF